MQCAAGHSTAVPVSVAPELPPTAVSTKSLPLLTGPTLLVKSCCCFLFAHHGRVDRWRIGCPRRGDDPSSIAALLRCRTGSFISQATRPNPPEHCSLRGALLRRSPFLDCSSPRMGVCPVIFFCAPPPVSCAMPCAGAVHTLGCPPCVFTHVPSACPVRALCTPGLCLMHVLGWSSCSSGDPEPRPFGDCYFFFLTIVVFLSIGTTSVSCQVGF